MRVLVLLAALATVAHAQPKPPPTQPKPPPAQPPPPQEDPIGDKLFPPDLIMKHQQDLGLDETTRKTIVARIQAFQTVAVKIQWDMKAASDSLAQLLSAPALDEAKILAEADKVMAFEHDLKKAHLSLLIKLRSSLTSAQQSKLRAARDK
jgi:Spy/CpxP family protein refolding chaperone